MWRRGRDFLIHGVRLTLLGPWRRRRAQLGIFIAFFLAALAAGFALSRR
jgi:hypothetical protein